MQTRACCFTDDFGLFVCCCSFSLLFAAAAANDDAAVAVIPSIDPPPFGCVRLCREKTQHEEQQRKENAANLERLRKRHESDKESARRTYMESKRWGVCTRTAV